MIEFTSEFNQVKIGGNMKLLKLFLLGLNVFVVFYIMAKYTLNSSHFLLGFVLSFCWLYILLLEINVKIKQKRKKGEISTGIM